jgi:hypothetical protein
MQLSSWLELPVGCFPVAARPAGDRVIRNMGSFATVTGRYDEFDSSIVSRDITI